MRLRVTLALLGTAAALCLLVATGRAQQPAVQAAASLTSRPNIVWISNEDMSPRLGVYGDKVADYLQYFNLFNAGLFAMHARSPVWARYRANLERSLPYPYDKMREQDALNIAILAEGVRAMPSTLVPSAARLATWSKTFQPSPKRASVNPRP